jgi:hypothetical protein
MRNGVLLFALAATCASPIHAQTEPSRGDDAAGRARQSWDRGEYDAAESLYRKSIEHGGLSPEAVLDAYVHLGACRAVLGRSDGALAAFKAAALLDAHFVVPPEAGRKASQLADRARRSVPAPGTIELRADVPHSLDPGEAAEVDATLDALHAAVATKVALFARDPTTGKSYEQSSDSATNVRFRLPGSLALPNATIVVRVDALDKHGNRLASVEQRLHVSAGATPVAVTPSLGLPARADAPRHEHDHDHESKKSHGFWASPWPYVLGGAALAAGGVAIYFAARPGEDVNVGAVRVNLTP